MRLSEHKRYLSSDPLALRCFAAYESFPMSNFPDHLSVHDQVLDCRKQSFRACMCLQQAIRKPFQRFRYVIGKVAANGDGQFRLLLRKHVSHLICIFPCRRKPEHNRIDVAFASNLNSRCTIRRN